MHRDEIIERLVGVPYMATGRDERGLDCYGLVLLVLTMMGKPRPPENLIKPQSLRAQINAFKDGIGEWVECDRVDGAVLVVGNHTPHHAGVILGPGVLHAQRRAGVCFEKRNPIFRGAKCLRWEGSSNG